MAEKGVSTRATDIITHFISDYGSDQVKAKNADVFLRTCSL